MCEDQLLRDTPGVYRRDQTAQAPQQTTENSKKNKTVQIKKEEI